MCSMVMKCHSIIDYIIHNNERSSLDKYQEVLAKNEFKVAFKNTVMQTWSKIKRENHKPSLKDMVDGMLKKKNREKGGGDNSNDQANKEAKIRQREERRRKRQLEQEEKMVQESKDSYLNVDQFVFLHKKIENAHKRLKE